ncbi:MAG: transporter, partial [Pyrinomonadaceae bacterium]
GTNRLELEAKVPYVYRSDNLSVTIPTLPRDPQSGEPPEIARGLNGDGLGDIELALHYQINRGLNGWPFFVGNVRWKSDTGEGPFDVDRDAFGVETELPTGSGFHSLEPSVTVLYPSDPAVFFANIGYLLNMEDDIDMTFVTQIDAPSGEETQTIGTVDPGDVFRFSFGMGYALNERSSFTLGYKHDFINETDTEINSVTVPSASLDVGSLLVGWGYSITNRFATNLNLELGITDDAPDVLMTLRVPILAHQF